MSVIDSDPQTDQPDGVATLRVQRSGSVDVPRLRALLVDGAWLGQSVDDPTAPPGLRRYLTDLVLPLPPDGRLLSFRKATLLDLGPVEPLGPDAIVVAVAWRSASLAPLFPVFAGRLEARPDGLTIEGRYAPPGGVVGRAADRMLLHVAARGTARWLLGHLADGIDGAAPGA